MKEKLLLASNNKKKLAELKAILGAYFDVISLSEAGIASDPEENGDTFAENSYIKAAAALKASGLASIADDSGLCVYSLNGAPGVHSARYAQENGRGEKSDDEANNALLLERLEGMKDRRAAFVSAITLLWPDGRELTAEGRCEGEILTAPRGSNGFGYDPLFYIREKDMTMAELSPDEKNLISHRGRALKILSEKIRRKEQ